MIGIGAGALRPFEQARDFFVAELRGLDGFESRHVEDDIALGIDKEAGGRAVNPIILSGPVPIATRIFQSDEIVVAHDFDGAFSLAADDVDGDDMKIIGLVLIEDLLQARKLRAAPLSTREPEIHENDLAAIVGELDLFVGDVLLEIKGRHWLGFGFASLPDVIVDLSRSFAEFCTVSK